MKKPKLYMPMKGGVAKAPEQKYDNLSTAYLQKDNREGRLHDITTDRGNFRFKENKKDA